MALKLAADAAYPPTYSKLPAGCAAVLGYVGGDTPHVWTIAEIATAEKRVGAWWAIWTAPSRGQKLTAAQGSSDGKRMVTALQARNYPTGRPVFYDVEQGTWAASPAGARAAITAWKTELHAAGWGRAYAYVPLSAGFDWLANWTGHAPTSLPAGVIGQQWAGQQPGGYDLSSFDESLWEDDMLDASDKKFIQAVVKNNSQAVIKQLKVVMANDTKAVIAALPAGKSSFTLAEVETALKKVFADAAS